MTESASRVISGSPQADANSTNTAFSTYPNPVSNILNFTGLEEEESFEIINIQGATLMKSETNQLDVSSLCSGMYFVRTQDHKMLRFFKK